MFSDKRKRKRRKRLRRWLCILIALILLLANAPPAEGRAPPSTRGAPDVSFPHETEEPAGAQGILERIVTALTASFFQRIAEEWEAGRAPPTCDAYGCAGVPAPRRMIGSFIRFFPDRGFAEAVAEQFDRSVNNLVTAAELSELYGTLDASGREIQCIAGAQYLTGVTELILCDNEISDLRYLEELSNLQSLHLHNNRINDTRLIALLPNLREWQSL